MAPSLTRAVACAVVAGAALAACGAPGHGAGGRANDKVPAAVAPAAGDGAPPGGAESAPALPHTLPGLGPKTRAQVPDGARQVVLVRGDGRDSSRSTVVLYQRTDDGWRAGPAWPAHNGFKGWTDDHHEGDLRSPIGVFTLTDAGGLLPDPGSKLPYDRSDAFTASGTGVQGEPLAGSFDYVVAINYNRVPGTSPLDWTRPLGPRKGGGIWLHVDHDGPTQGCVSLERPHMRDLLRTLDPELHPVVVMGDAASLAR
jgi:L,D-peptidoglycan transpeptidase YkuD (ErfK/YbiS/YcfS/YnhG family)